MSNRNNDKRVSTRYDLHVFTPGARRAKISGALLSFGGLAVSAFPARSSGFVADPAGAPALRTLLEMEWRTAAASPAGKSNPDSASIPPPIYMKINDRNSPNTGDLHFLISRIAEHFRWECPALEALVGMEW
jgi:hypothetical protein